MVYSGCNAVARCWVSMASHPASAYASSVGHFTQVGVATSHPCSKSLARESTGAWTQQLGTNQQSVFLVQLNWSAAASGVAAMMLRAQSGCGIAPRARQLPCLAVQGPHVAPLRCSQSVLTSSTVRTLQVLFC